MKILKLSGLAMIAGLLLIAAPDKRAEAAPLSTPGIAAAVQRDAIPQATEVQYRHHRHMHRHHHRWHRHHHVRRHYGHRHHHHHYRHHHHRHWR
ncbi:hypothetical protein [Rhodopseudomonas sp. BR0M22]|uniref:hypothetical protein n=1 Tax=Rhodopseudomonas sp. BR0M22 TaxID=2269369 RepID=UPI0013E01753|nr:hypothetical protein [Rhodopseudomonas sp. BR0M22]NEW94562.1 hypothetical protein [Rhodopseudomonas sp. BR0M22]